VAKTCAICNTSSPDHAAICPKCKTKFPPPGYVAPMAGSKMCPACGVVQAAGAIFCNQCGATFTTAESPAPVTPQIAQPVSQKKSGIPVWGWIAAGVFGFVFVMCGLSSLLPKAPGSATPTAIATTVATTSPGSTTPSPTESAAYIAGQNLARAILGQPPLPTPIPPPPPSKEAAEYLDPRMLVGDPTAYKDRNIFLQGMANNVEQKGDYTWVNFLAGVRDKDSTTEAIVIEVRPKAPSILKQECYRFYGVTAGSQKVRVLLTGAEREVPIVNVYDFESAPKAQYYGCKAP
jgi:hypothetical protein